MPTIISSYVYGYYASNGGELRITVYDSGEFGICDDYCMSSYPRSKSVEEIERIAEGILG